MDFRKPFTQKKVVTVVAGESLTKQSFRDECDINTILKKYQKTGLLDFVNNHQAQYGDFTGFDFAQSMNVVAKANEMFADLPAVVRKRFNNDPVEFVAFVDNGANRDEAIRLGLIVPPPDASPGVPAGVTPAVVPPVAP